MDDCTKIFANNANQCESEHQKKELPTPNVIDDSMKCYVVDFFKGCDSWIDRFISSFTRHIANV
jgi:hypothetical protein